MVEIEEMCDRIKASVDARIDNQFMIMARTDALATDGLMRELWTVVLPTLKLALTRFSLRRSLNWGSTKNSLLGSVCRFLQI